ncbi:hypothetical protein DIPPA_17506 [Diplonema papillatum]|nr:hypothetical protein DIPPA_17506 [Diplonema papillatum]|eukprot:gene18197-28036_t
MGDVDLVHELMRLVGRPRHSLLRAFPREPALEASWVSERESPALAEDARFCQAVFLWLTDLLGHPVGAVLLEEMRGDAAAPAVRGDNQLLCAYAELVSSYAVLFRGYSRKLPRKIPLELLNEFSRRSIELRKEWSWSVPTLDALATIAEYAPLVEVGSGTAFWASLLKQKGVDWKCYDSSAVWNTALNTFQDGAAGGVPKHYGDIETGGPEVLKDDSAQGRTLVLMWPDFMGRGTFGLECLRHYLKGSAEYLILVGEWADSTLGSYTTDLPPTGQSFSVGFQLLVAQHYDLHKRVDLPNWPLFADCLMVWKRKANPAQRNWSVDEDRFLGRYLVASEDIEPRIEVIAGTGKSARVRTSKKTENRSKYLEMFESVDLPTFSASGLQSTGADEHIASEIAEDVTTHHPEFKEGGSKAHVLPQVVSVGLSFHYNGFGGPVGDADEGQLELTVLPLISYCNHSCDPNAHVSPSEGCLRTLRSVAKGDAITISYLNDDQLLLSKDARQALLFQRWGFACQCARCRLAYDDTRLFSAYRPAVRRLEEDATFVAYQDPDGDAVKIRLNVGAETWQRGLVYSVNGDDRPVTCFVKREGGALAFFDIDRGLDLPGGASDEVAADIATLAERARAVCEGVLRGACEACGGHLVAIESRAAGGGAAVSCARCGGAVPAMSGGERLREEEDFVADCLRDASFLTSSASLERCFSFSLHHPQHRVALDFLLALRKAQATQKTKVRYLVSESSLECQYVYTTASLAEACLSSTAAAANHLADCYGTWAEVLIRHGHTQRATDAFNEQDTLRHVNDAPNSAWSSVPQCQPNAEVMAFLFKD